MSAFFGNKRGNEQKIDVTHRATCRFGFLPGITDIDRSSEEIATEFDSKPEELTDNASDWVSIAGLVTSKVATLGVMLNTSSTYFPLMADCGRISLSGFNAVAA